MALNNTEIVAKKIMTPEHAAFYIRGRKLLGDKVVFTNGCFDILHLGHVDYLAKSADLGHILVVGLNTDASVKRQNKSPERPINNEQARATILSSLHFVDVVVLFDEDTPLELIKALKPNILVKGSDYTIDTIVGAKEVLAKGGEVKMIDLVEGYSTTNLAQKLKS